MSESQTQSVFAAQRALIDRQREFVADALERQVALARVAADGIETGEAAADASIEMWRLATQTPVILAGAVTLDGDDVAETRAQIDERFDDIQVVRADAFAELDERYEEALEEFDDATDTYLTAVDRQTEALLDAQERAVNMAALPAQRKDESTDVPGEEFREVGRFVRSQVREFHEGIIENMERSRRQFARHLTGPEPVEPIEVDVDEDPLAEVDEETSADVSEPTDRDAGRDSSAGRAESEAMD